MSADQRSSDDNRRVALDDQASAAPGLEVGADAVPDLDRDDLETVDLSTEPAGDTLRARADADIDLVVDEPDQTTAGDGGARTGTADASEAADDAEPSGRVKPWESFRIRNFRYLWANSIAFAMLQNTQRFALVWLMLEVYDRASQAGVMSFALGIPVLLFSMQFGAIADRVNRRTMLMVTQAAAGAVSAVIAALLFLDLFSFPVMISLTFVLGITLAGGMPVRRAIIPTIVPKKLLMNAIVLNGFAQNISIIVGPIVAGTLIEVFDVKGAFVMTTCLYVIGVLFLRPIKLDPILDEHGRPPKREKGAVRDGLRFIARHAGIRTLFMFLAIAALFLVGPWQVLVPQLGRVHLDIEVQQVTMLFTALGVGTVLSTVIQASLGDIKRKGLTFLIVVSGCGTMLASVGLSTSYPLTLGLMFIWGIAGGFFMNLIQTLIQSNTPAHYLGRVSSVQTVSMQGVAPAGALLAGWGADTFTVVVWLMVCGAALLGSALLIGITQPSLREM